MTQLTKHTPIEEIIGYRDAALLKANEAIAMIIAGFSMMKKAQGLASDGLIRFDESGVSVSDDLFNWCVFG